MRTAAPSTIAASITWPVPDALGLEDAAHDAEREQHAAATEVTDEVDGRRRLASRPSEVRERARKRDVVDVVAGGLRGGTFLTPARHPAEHELRVARQAHVGADPESLGHAGAKALDERVGLLDETHHGLDTLGLLQVDADRPAPAVEQFLVGRGEVGAHLLRAIDAQHVGAHVGKHHGGERAGPDAGDLDDLHSTQRSHVAPRSVGRAAP